MAAGDIEPSWQYTLRAIESLMEAQRFLDPHEHASNVQYRLARAQVMSQLAIAAAIKELKN